MSNPALLVHIRSRRDGYEKSAQAIEEKASAILDKEDASEEEHIQAATDLLEAQLMFAKCEELTYLIGVVEQQMSTPPLKSASLEEELNEEE